MGDELRIDYFLSYHVGYLSIPLRQIPFQAASVFNRSRILLQYSGSAIRDDGGRGMTLRCPECGERTFTIVEYYSKGGSWTRHTEKAVYECKTCSYREVV